MEEATEDYLETINSLIREKGFAASMDIAEKMKVSKPTVINMVKKLHKQGYLIHEKYRGVDAYPKRQKARGGDAEKARADNCVLGSFRNRRERGKTERGKE